ncbi:hypothetical protein [Anaerobacillus alkaliphilus]|uniref:hypothetical protein n=1 Tax=Anaerobacillus alkaliphilus TaxID=1548597 RepID=UPI001F4FDE42|nr:hypothetical protein [Anaerobacillus alkaliphilus]
MKNGQIEKFRKFSQFENVEEFNAHLNRWLDEVGHEFSKSERIALKFLSRYAVNRRSRQCENRYGVKDNSLRIQRQWNFEIDNETNVCESKAGGNDHHP